MVLSKYFGTLEMPAMVAAVGLALPQPRRWMLSFWAVALFIIWYTVMFNALRWSVPAVLMLLASAFVTWTWVADRIAVFWNPQWPTMIMEAGTRWCRKSSRPWTAFASILFAFFLLFGLLQFKQRHDDSWLPTWMDRDLAAALFSPARMDRYLAKSRPGFSLYRYIGRHDLKKVLQPFDNGGMFDASSYNGGHSNDWVLDFRLLPATAAQTDSFVVQNGIHYFVDREPVKPIDIERMGPDHIALAKAVIARLKLHARLILRDDDMYLYAIQPRDAQP